MLSLDGQIMSVKNMIELAKESFSCLWADLGLVLQQIKYVEQY